MRTAFGHILTCAGVFLTVTLLLVQPMCRPALAATESSLRQTLQQEETRAKARQDSLKRLTAEEKELDKSLAEAEAAILALEKNLAGHRSNLAGLASAGEAVQQDYDRILKEQQKTGRALEELFSTMWGLHTRRQSVGGRAMENWTAIDREYYWTADLLKSIDAYQNELAAREMEMAGVIGKRDSIGRDIAEQMDRVDEDKSKLLSERLKYEQRLTVVRKQRQSAEAELNATLKLIADLNFDIENLRQANISIDRAKGLLPWPTSGTIVQRFSPASRPPVRGLGFSTGSNADVRTVHSGKVMFRDTMRGLGQVVVVQHGRDYFSVYAFLSDSAVSLGQNVNRGQTLGRCGYYPAISGNGLYFELRHHQEAVNPAVWLVKS